MIPPIPPSAPYKPTTQPSSYYVFHYPCRQDAGTYNLIDVSGNRNDALYNSGGQTESNYWTNKGYVTVSGGTNYDFRVPLSTAGKTVTGFDLNTNSFLTYAVMNMSIPAASFNLFGNGSSAGSNQGFYLSVRTSTGKVRPVIIHSSGNLNGLSDSNLVFCDSTDHHVAIVWDHITRDIILYKDGSISNVYPNNSSVGNTASVNTNWSIGSDADTGTNTTTTAMIKGHGLMIFPNGIPANISQAVGKLAREPLVPLLDADLVYL